jgi:hypothetical protein
MIIAAKTVGLLRCAKSQPKMKTLPIALAACLAVMLCSCSTTPDTVAITGGVEVHGHKFPASLRDNSKWITYAGHNFRMNNVLEAKLGAYGYKRAHALDVQGDMPGSVKMRTAYTLDVTYDSVAALNKLGANVPKIAGGEVSASNERTGKYKLYVLMADDQTEWKDSIRKAVAKNDENVVDQLKRSDGYFRFVDAVLVISDFEGKRKIESKLKANATYKAVRAELDAGTHSGSTQTGLEPRVVGYSLRGACWGPPNYSHLITTPEDRPGANDSGECQNEPDHSPVFQSAAPAPKKR